jgi:hypothetical protein
MIWLICQFYFNNQIDYIKVMEPYTKGMTGGAYAFNDSIQTHFYLPRDAEGDIGFGQALDLSEELHLIGAPGDGWDVQKYGAMYHY